MKALITTLLLSLLSFFGIAQPVQWRDLTFNDIFFRHNTDGSLFENTQEGRGFYRIPADGKSGTIFASQLWFGSVLSSGDTATLVGSYTFNGSETLPGPISKSYDSDYFSRYYKSWILTSEQVKFHREHYQDFGYIAIPEITSWPANGRDTLDSKAALAPYFDVNQNSLYDPENGDYPAIPGDMNLFYMKNSCSNQTANTTGGKKLKLQISGFLYAFTATTAPMKTTLFHKIIVVNGDTEEYKDLYMGTWIDLDIGGHFDDYGATDTTLQTVYGYNADNGDFGSHNPYGENPPVQGFTWLNAPLSSSTVYWYPYEPEKTYAPYYYYLSGKNFDGSDKAGGKFDFPGDPVTADMNSEPGMNDTAGDRRILATTNLGSLLPGEVKCIDGAYIWSRSGDNNIDNVAIFRNEVEYVREFYNTWLYGECQQYSSGIGENEISTLSVYPNPSNSSIHISGLPQDRAFAVEIIDALGRTVLSSSLQSELDISPLEKGVYLIQVNGENGRFYGSITFIRN